MKYTQSLMLSELSGTAGSTTASRNRFGPYLRTRTIGMNPNTASQVAQRNSFSASTRAWKALTAGQRAAWSSAASFIVLYDSLGRPYTPSGFQYFMSVNRTTYIYSGATTTTTTPPSTAIPTAIATASPAADSAGLTFTVGYTATPLAGATKLIIACTPQISAGISFVKQSLYRQILITAAAAASPANIYAAYIAKYGVLIANKKIALKLTPIDSQGNRGAPFFSSCTVS